MKYAIFQVDDSRQHYVDGIRHELSQDGHWEEIDVWCVDGSDPEQLAKAQQKWTFPVKFEARLGHLGIWYSVLNALEHAPIVTIEDDAILMEDQFEIQFHHRVDELPDDFDFFSLFIPRDSDHLYTPAKHDYPGGLTTCRSYFNYGGVSMLFSEKGARNFLDLVGRDGMISQWDNQIHHYARYGELKGFSSIPMFPDLVRITGVEKSIVQETEFI